MKEQPRKPQKTTFWQSFFLVIVHFHLTQSSFGQVLEMLPPGLSGESNWVEVSEAEPQLFQLDDVPVGQIAHRHFRIRNNGNETLRNPSFNIQWSEPFVSGDVTDQFDAYFTFIKTTNRKTFLSSLPTGRTDEFYLIFCPLTLGELGARFSISYDDYTTPEVVLEGTGTGSPDTTVSASSSPITGSTTVAGIPNASDSWDFDSALNLNTSTYDSAYFRIRNGGNISLDIGSITIAGDAFSLIGPTPTSSIPAFQSSSQFEVRFQPTDPGDYFGELVVNTNDPDNPNISIELTGGATRPITPPPNSPRIGYTRVGFEQLLDLNGEIPINSAIGSSGSQTLKLTNVGGLNLAINQVTVTGDFSIPEPPSSLVLEPGASYDVVINHSPTELGRSEGRIRVLSNAAVGSDRTFDLAGFGYPVDGSGLIEVSGRASSSNSFRPIPNGSSAENATTINGTLMVFGSRIPTFNGSVEKVYIIRNVGGSDISLTDIFFSGPDSIDYTIIGAPESGTVLAPFEEAVFNVIFDPTSILGSGRTDRISQLEVTSGSIAYSATFKGPATQSVPNLSPNFEGARLNIDENGIPFYQEQNTPFEIIIPSLEPQTGNSTRFPDTPINDFWSARFRIGHSSGVEILTAPVSTDPRFTVNFTRNTSNLYPYQLQVSPAPFEITFTPGPNTVPGEVIESEISFSTNVNSEPNRSFQVRAVAYDPDAEPQLSIETSETVFQGLESVSAVVNLKGNPRRRYFIEHSTDAINWYTRQQHPRSFEPGYRPTTSFLVSAQAEGHTVGSYIIAKEWSPQLFIRIVEDVE